MNSVDFNEIRLREEIHESEPEDLLRCIEEIARLTKLIKNWGQAVLELSMYRT